MELVYRESAADLLRMANQGTSPDFAVRSDSRRELRAWGTACWTERLRGGGVLLAQRSLHVPAPGLSRRPRRPEPAAGGSPAPRSPPGVDETLAPVLAGTMPWRAELSGVKASGPARHPPASARSAREHCCCAGTSPVCVGATCSSSPRTPPSVRSTTG
ncbi:hypothetical protein QJS66_22755 [Kocuria rhizophila]|nr:hypothetical protein QJS66_22755 [Kocuria rhizophila]